MLRTFQHLKYYEISKEEVEYMAKFKINKKLCNGGFQYALKTQDWDAALKILEESPANKRLALIQNSTLDGENAFFIAIKARCLNVVTALFKMLSKEDCSRVFETEMSAYPYTVLKCLTFTKNAKLLQSALEYLPENEVDKLLKTEKVLYYSAENQDWETVLTLIKACPQNCRLARMLEQEFQDYVREESSYFMGTPMKHIILSGKINLFKTILFLLDTEDYQRLITTKKWGPYNQTLTECAIKAKKWKLIKTIIVSLPGGARLLADYQAINKPEDAASVFDDEHFLKYYLMRVLRFDADADFGDKHRMLKNYAQSQNGQNISLQDFSLKLAEIMDGSKNWKEQFGF